MPYANEDNISQNRIDGGIIINNTQYKEGIEALQSGKHISIINGFEVVELTDNILSEPITVNSERRNTHTKLAERYSKSERAGVLVNGIKVRTDFKTQTKLHMALTFMQLSGVKTIDWEVSQNKWVELDIKNLRKIIVATGNYLQKVKVNKKEISNEIEMKTNIGELVDMPIDQGWPEEEKEDRIR